MNTVVPLSLALHVTLRTPRITDSSACRSKVSAAGSKGRISDVALRPGLGLGSVRLRAGLVSACRTPGGGVRLAYRIGSSQPRHFGCRFQRALTGQIW